MVIPCDSIRRSLIDYLRQTAAQASHRHRLLAVLVGDAPDQLSYVRIKEHIAKEIGAGFELLQVPLTIQPEAFYELVQKRACDPAVTGVIVQQPLPVSFDVKKVYSLIPREKDIEGQRGDNDFLFPLVQACMIGLQWAYCHIQGGDFYASSLPFQADKNLVAWLKEKNIVIAGNGITTGKKIAPYFDSLGISFSQTDSKTQNPERLYKEADIIITGVGKPVITPDSIKKGVILLNVGLRKEKDAEGKSHLKGDYDEEKIQDTAALYTKTPNGLGPIDVVCLYGNLLAAKHHTN